ncbi:MAG: SH3 domain-containing protein, partial [Planctomycetota bacterium]
MPNHFARALTTLPTGLAFFRWPASVFQAMHVYRITWQAVILLNSLLLAGQLGAWEPPAAERVRVVNQETLLFSAPDDNAYATDLLPQGAQLEVLERTPEGWLAVRPATGSFSWIPASKVRLHADGRTAEVITDDAVTWIGSRMETVSRHEPGIRLRRAEVVTILGNRELQDDRTGEASQWIQIQPPAGDVRWLRAAEVVTNAAATNSAATDSGATPPVQPVGFISDRSARSDQWVAKNSTPSRSANPAPNVTPNALASSGGGGGFSGSGFSGSGNRALPFPALPGSSSSPNMPSSTAAPAPSTVMLTPEQFLREYETVNLQLSQLAAKPVGSWNFTTLRERTARLIDSGPTSIDRGKARLLLDKIDEFAGLQRQYQIAERNVAAPPRVTPQPLSPVTNPTGPGADSPIGTGVARTAGTAGS